MDSDFLQARIDATKTQIVAYEDAVAALIGGAASYTLNTSQSVQSVTKHNLKDMQATIDSLYNRLATLDARLNGSGSMIVIPGF